MVNHECANISHTEGIELYKHYFDTMDDVLEDLRRRGLWPMTLVMEASPALPIHRHHVDMYTYVMEGTAPVLHDPEGDSTYEITRGDLMIMRAGTYHAESHTSARVTYIIGFPRPGHLYDLVRSMPEEDRGKLALPAWP